VEFQSDDILLVTGATGLVGSHVCQRARELGIKTRALVRESSDKTLLGEWGVDLVYGDLNDLESLDQAASGVTALVHCAAKVGDWGPIDDYRRVNVDGTRALLEAVEKNGTLKRVVHVSSLGVYQARDHHGTDETEPLSLSGIDGYTLTKAESEQLVRSHIDNKQLPAIILRPGFIYGPRDRTVLPRITERLCMGGFKFLGTGNTLLNNTYVGNLVDAVFLALEKDELIGEVFNITDGALVTKREFISTIASLAGYPVPEKNVPLFVAKALAVQMEFWQRLYDRWFPFDWYWLPEKNKAPLLNNARIKFLGLNLDFSIDKAKQQLGYEPQIKFETGMQRAIGWCREAGLLVREEK
jgi:nucleoside-diphosphate-sugar epimerase